MIKLLLLLISISQVLSVQYTFTNLKDAYVSSVNCNSCGINEVSTAFGNTDPTSLDVGEIYYDFGGGWLSVGKHKSLLGFDISSMPTTATGCIGNLTLFTASGSNCPNEVSGLNQLITIYESADFNENTVTWNTMPTTGTQIQLAGSNSPYQDGVLKKIQLPLGSYVQSKRAASATTVYVQIHTTNNEVCKFASKEHATSSKRPTFTVTCN